LAQLHALEHGKDSWRQEILSKEEDIDCKCADVVHSGKVNEAFYNAISMRH
jgi:hypothetical protein